MYMLSSGQKPKEKYFDPPKPVMTDLNKFGEYID
jgi:hypothetical protein